MTLNRRATYENRRKSSSVLTNKTTILVAVIVLLLVIYGVVKLFGQIFESINS